MINITLPDGSIRPFEHPVSVGEVALSIGPGLAKAALAGKVDGKLVDTSHRIDHDAALEIVTEKHPDALEVLRHSTAHLLAQAVQRLFPGAQVTIGPVIDNGFYYDFAYERPFTPDDLPKIEEEMQKIVKESIKVERSVMPRDEAVAFFSNMGEKYKAEIIGSIPSTEDISLYRQGDFIDLCRGPHVPGTDKLRAFKLMKVAGAYWRGDSNNQMLSRIYGTAWLNDKDLKAYLTQLEEAEKRDHRKIAKAQNLFHQQEQAPGMVFWHPKGWAIWQVVEQHMRGVYRTSGYHEVRAPQILDVSLWKASGHWDNYKDNMFFTESEKREYALKPMNCPGHVQIFNHGLHSYRDLPIRYGEFGGCHRNEPSGALHGIMRVRAFTQDDGHIFCTEDQIESEVTAFHEQAMKVYSDFGFSEIALKIALRPDKRLGSDEVWDKAEGALRAALAAAGVSWEELPGEGAFYGPKIEYHMKDSIGRAWQVGTMQVDFMMPERLGAEYVDEHSTKRHPVMLHRAIVGSMERFIGILIENHAGNLPVWLAPVQAVVLNITDAQADAVETARASLENQGFRVEADLRNEKIGYKIREHAMQRIPYLLVIGDREKETGAVAVRTRSGEDLGTMRLEDFIDRLRDEARPAHTEHPQHPRKEEPRINTDKQNRKNQEIRVPRVRLIDAEGENVGVVERDAALQMAEDAGMDLVEIQPNADPPVCRIMDFGKFKFEAQKKAAAAKKKQKTVEIKELKFRPTTDDGDYNIKLRNLRRFLEEGDKVKVNIRFKGREMAHQELGLQMAARIEADLADEVVIEQRARLEGRQMIMMMSPKKK